MRWMSISARGATDDVEEGVATWLPGLLTCVAESAVVAKISPRSMLSGKCTENRRIAAKWAIRLRPTECETLWEPRTQRRLTRPSTVRAFGDLGSWQGGFGEPIFRSYQTTPVNRCRFVHFGATKLACTPSPLTDIPKKPPHRRRRTPSPLREVPKKSPEHPHIHSLLWRQVTVGQRFFRPYNSSISQV